MRLSQVLKYAVKIAIPLVTLQLFYSPQNVLAINTWQVGNNGLEWQDIGELTGLTTDGNSILPAVVDSTTNAGGLLELQQRHLQGMRGVRCGGHTWQAAARSLVTLSASFLTSRHLSSAWWPALRMRIAFSIM